MTCIVAFKQDGKTFIAGDLLGSNGYEKKNVADSKVFKKGNLYIGYTTTFRFGQVIEHVWTPPRHIKEDKSDMQYLVADVVPSLNKCFKESGLKVCEPNTGYGQCVVVYNGEIYSLHVDESIIRYHDYASVGSGSSVAEALMNYHSDGLSLNDQFSVEKLFEVTERMTCGVSKEYTILECV